MSNYNYLDNTVDLIKMDIEGSEISILIDSQKIWNLKPICVMENSTHGPSIAGISKNEWISLVAGKGYDLVDFASDARRSSILLAPSRRGWGRRTS